MRVVEVRHQALLEGADLVDRHIIHVALGGRIDGEDLIHDVHRLVLGLLEQFDEAVAAIYLALRNRIQFSAELRKRLQFAERRQVQAQRAGDLLHGLDLRVAADAAHRDADVDGRAHARVKEVRLQVDLPVGDGDHVGRDVGGDFAFLRLDDGQRGQAPAGAVHFGDLVSGFVVHLLEVFAGLALTLFGKIDLPVHAILLGNLAFLGGGDDGEFLGQFCGALQEPRMQIEDVAWVGLAARRAAQEQ